MKKETAINILNSVLSYLNISSYGLSKRLGMNRPQGLYDVLNVNRKVGVSKKLADKICAEFPEFNLAWLLTGDGEMLKEQESVPTELKVVDPNYIDVPFVNANAYQKYRNGYNDVQFIKELPSIRVYVDNSFEGKYRCFEILGSGMEDGSVRSICARDTVLAREVKKELWHNKLYINQCYFILSRKEGLVLKQIVDHDPVNGTISCRSFNPLYCNQLEVNLDDVLELYNVIKIVERDLRF